MKLHKCKSSTPHWIYPTHWILDSEANEKRKARKELQKRKRWMGKDGVRKTGRWNVELLCRKAYDQLPEEQLTLEGWLTTVTGTHTIPLPLEDLAFLFFPVLAAARMLLLTSPPLHTSNESTKRDTFLAEFMDSTDPSLATLSPTALYQTRRISPDI